MTAGLVTYKLCDRDLDCERCPLDAALRGHPVSATASRSRHPVAWVFPDDRRYGNGHVWAKADAKAGIRVGVDAFAAELLAHVSAVRMPRAGCMLQAGDDLCEVHGYPGRIVLKAPFAGRLLSVNDSLSQDPDAATADPYAAGWLAELSPGGLEPEVATARLLSAVEMRKRARADMQRFRRQVAMQLLVDTSSVGPAMADGGEGLTDLRQMLGASRYLAVVTELLS